MSFGPLQLPSLEVHGPQGLGNSQMGPALISPNEVSNPPWPTANTGSGGVFNGLFFTTAAMKRHTADKRHLEQRIR